MIIERGEGDILKILKSALNFKIGEGSEVEIENASRGVTRLRRIFKNDTNTNSRATMGAPHSLTGSEQVP